MRMRRATEDDHDRARRGVTLGSPRRGPQQAACKAWSSFARFLRQSPSTTWPAHVLLVVGLLVVTLDVVLRLWQIVAVPHTAGVQANSEVVRPVATVAQAVLPEPAAAPPTVAPIPTPFLRPSDAAGRAIAAQPAALAPPRLPAPTPTPTSDLTTASPEGAVRAFYYLLGHRDFQAMVWLFSARMHDTMPSDPGLFSDRTPPGQLMIQQLTLVSVDGARNNATVSVDVLEQLSPADTKRYVGTWKVVRGPTGWLLDEPDIHLE
jgi:hypothetical protein